MAHTDLLTQMQFALNGLIIQRLDLAHAIFVIGALFLDWT